MANTILTTGMQFNSFEDFEKSLENYEQHEKQKFGRKNSHKMKPPIPKGVNAALIYDHLLYACSRSGTYIPKGNNIRRTSSKKTGCPAKMILSPNDAKQKLIITEMISDHNHEPLEESRVKKRKAEDSKPTSNSNKRKMLRGKIVDNDQLESESEIESDDRDDEKEIRDKLMQKLSKMLSAAADERLIHMLDALKSMIDHFQKGNDVTISVSNHVAPESLIHQNDTGKRETSESKTDSTDFLSDYENSILSDAGQIDSKNRLSTAEKIERQTKKTSSMSCYESNRFAGKSPEKKESALKKSSFPTLLDTAGIRKVGESSGTQESGLKKINPHTPIHLEETAEVTEQNQDEELSNSKVTEDEKSSFSTLADVEKTDTTRGNHRVAESSDTHTNKVQKSCTSVDSGKTTSVAEKNQVEKSLKVVRGRRQVAELSATQRIGVKTSKPCISILSEEIIVAAKVNQIGKSSDTKDTEVKISSSSALADMMTTKTTLGKRRVRESSNTETDEVKNTRSARLQKTIAVAEMNLLEESLRNKDTEIETPSLTNAEKKTRGALRKRQIAESSGPQKISEKKPNLSTSIDSEGTIVVPQINQAEKSPGTKEAEVEHPSSSADTNETITPSGTLQVQETSGVQKTKCKKISIAIEPVRDVKLPFAAGIEVKKPSFSTLVEAKNTTVADELYRDERLPGLKKTKAERRGSEKLETTAIDGETNTNEKNSDMMRNDEEPASPSTTVDSKETTTTFKVTHIGQTLATTADSNDENVADINIQKIKGRGRPKGKNLTAIGLPVTATPIRFANKTKGKKIKDMLSWLVQDNIIQNILDRECLIKREDIDLSPTKLRDSFTDESVTIQWIKKYFEIDAFNMLVKAIKEKEKKGLYTCGACSKKLMAKQVRCGSCLLRYDISCTSLTRTRQIWFCKKCTGQ